MSHSEKSWDELSDFSKIMGRLSHPTLWVWGMGVATPTNRLRTSRAFQRAQEHLSSLSGSRDSHTPYFWVFASYPLWVWGMGVVTYQNAHRTSRPFQRAQEHLSTTSGGFKNYVAKISMVLWFYGYSLKTQSFLRADPKPAQSGACA